MALLQPTAVFRSIERITPEFLNERGIRALILDVDNTLTAHGSQELPKTVEKWLDTMREAGVQMVIASNNFEKRVAPFAKRIGVSHCSFCCKPAPMGLARAHSRLNAGKHETALVGDQIFTDAMGANLYGIAIFLVEPLSKDINFGIRLKRALERPVLQRYYRRGGRLL